MKKQITKHGVDLLLDEHTVIAFCEEYIPRDEAKRVILDLMSNYELTDAQKTPNSDARNRSIRFFKEKEQKRYDALSYSEKATANRLIDTFIDSLLDMFEEDKKFEKGELQ
jgi:hypothetical protein